jgi:hypothetical protein
MKSTNLAAAALVLGLVAGAPARAHGEASAVSAVSALPLASVVVGTGAAASAVAAVPVVLSTAGAVLVVKTVESTVRGTVVVLERASDGAQASFELGARAAGAASLAAGTLVTVSVIGAGVLLSAAGEVIAFIPNALGRALLHNERLGG